MWTLRAIMLVALLGALSAWPSLPTEGMPAATTWTVTDTSDSATNSGSLRYALANAQNGDAITFDPVIFSAPQTITLSSTLSITTNVTITGPGPNLLTLDGAGKYQVLSIPGGVSATISGITIAHGNSVAGESNAASGGGIYNSGTLTLSNSTLSGNSASTSTNGGDASSGGGIYNAGTLTVSDSTLSDNSTNGFYIGISGVINSGGGIYSSGTLIMSDSTLHDNSIYGNSIYGATAGTLGGGGGIYNSGTLTVSNSTLSGNSVNGNSGFLNSLFTGGGGIYNDSGGALIVGDSTLSANSAASNVGPSGVLGGGIYNSGTLTVSNSTLSGNSATGTYGAGGGIYNTGNAALTVSRSTLSGNSASGGAGGGGIYNTGTGPLTVSNSTLSSNSAGGAGGVYGGGISNNANAGPLTVSNSTLSDNSISGGNVGPGSGGGISNSGTLTISNSVVSGNRPYDIPGYAAPGTDIVGLTVYGTTYTLGQILAVQADGITPLLANDGGPTQTIALVAGSPAIGLGRDCVGADGSTPLTTDQRGYLRSHAPATCDAGAYEFAGAATYNIQQGWNLFAYTDASTGISTASLLLSTLLHQSGGSLAAIYGLTQDQWLPSLIDVNGSFSPPDGDFVLQPYTGYLLYAARAVTLSLPTPPAPQQSFSYPIQQGWNIFAFSGSVTSITTADHLLGALLQQRGGTLAALYGLTTDGWTPSLVDNNGTFSAPGFSLQPNSGYLLYSDRAVPFQVQAGVRDRLRLQGTKRVHPLLWQRSRQQVPPLPPLP